MKKSNYILAAATLTIAVMLTGCGGKSDQKSENTGDNDSAEGTSQDDVLDFDVTSYVKLEDYKGLEVTFPSVEQVTDEDVEQYIQEQLEEYTEYEEVDRASKEGDIVNIDYTGTMDGEEFEGGSDTGYDLEIGSEDFLPEFEESLIGKKTGETAVFTITFPEDYDDTLAGQEAEFTVNINSVSEAVAPEYNVDFVKEISDYETLEEYEASIKEELTASAEEDSQIEAGEHALMLVSENAEINGYPQDLYDFFYNDNVSGYKEFAEMQGMEYEEFLETFMSEEDIIEVVEEELYDYMVSMAILEKEGVKYTDEDYAKEAEELALYNEYESLEEYEADFGKNYIKTQLIREKAIELLKEAVTLQEVPWEEYYEEDMELDEE